MVGPIDVTLPGGCWLDGTRRQEATLRPLTGEDEAFLLEEAAALPPAQRSTQLLARCLVGVGPSRGSSAETARMLTAGDREALLLHLRRLAFGERIDCVLDCPACGEALQLELEVGDLLAAPYADCAPEHEAELAGERVRFRLPTGADQEAAALAGGAEAAERLILRRCVREPARVPDALVEPIGELMGELDPQADPVLSFACPECGDLLSVPFDAGDFLTRELGRSRDALLHEIHVLALHYHWPESELVSMTPGRRRRYLSYLVGALER